MINPNRLPAKYEVDNSLLIDRAMLESEKYINVKRNLSERIKAKQIEMENHQKQFDEVTRDYEKKSQVSKESLNQLSEQIRATSVKIEASYLGNRLDKERAKLQQLNKDYEMAQSAFKKDQDAFQAEIDKFQAEIEKRKTQAEEAMIAECQTYVNKVYSQVTDAVIHLTEPVVKDLEDKQLELQ